jgi:beta-1,4-N-acetylglucosaminyltransferase
MIFVTVGTPSQKFIRLVKAADDLAAQINEPVIIQYGYSNYPLKYAEGFAFESNHRMNELTSSARVIVTHAAAGAIITAVRYNKPLILVARLKKYNEHYNDHQLELYRALVQSKKAVGVQDPSAHTLTMAIQKALTLNIIYPGPEQILFALRQQLALWDKKEKI